MESELTSKQKLSDQHHENQYSYSSARVFGNERSDLIRVPTHGRELPMSCDQRWLMGRLRQVTAQSPGKQEGLSPSLGKMEWSVQTATPVPMLTSAGRPQIN